MSLRAAKKIQQQTDKQLRILDLRWLQPLNKTQLTEHADQCARVLIVDEGRQTGSISETIVTTLIEESSHIVPISRITGADSYTPLGKAATKILPSNESITAAGIGTTIGRLQLHRDLYTCTVLWVLKTDSLCRQLWPRPSGCVTSSQHHRRDLDMRR